MVTLMGDQVLLVFFKKNMGQPRPLFVYFRLLPHCSIKSIDESVDSVLGTQTQGGRMEGTA